MSHQRKHRYAVHGAERSRGSEAVCQYLPGIACKLLQRTGYVCRGEGTGHPGHHPGHLSGPAYRHALQ